jgi:hypothetical protein
MRTTIDIPTPLFKRAKAAAAKEGATLRDVLVRALQAYLAQPTAAKPYKFEWKGVSLGRIPEDELWELMHDQDRQWYKDYLAELKARKR